MSGSIQREVAPGVHRLFDRLVAFWIVEEEGRLLLVDAGLPSSFGLLERAVGQLGRTMDDLEAVVLTHAHADHLGIARRLQDAGVPVWCHERDARIAAHPLKYPTERSPLLYARHPSVLKALGGLVAGGTLRVRGLPDVRTFGDDPAALSDLPGRPVVVPTPGHTPGHTAFHFPDRDAVVVGDALVTYDPYTGREGPRLIARAAMANSADARRSLEVLFKLRKAGMVLPGHGHVWSAGIGAAVESARAAGQA